MQQWFYGIRLYIAMATVLVTGQVYWWTTSVYGDSSLAAIRLQEIYAWIALGLLLLALSIAPLCSVIKKLPGKPLLRDARRMLGLSAAWFASLHVGITYIDQFKAANPFSLPVIYQWTFFIGLVALIILLALAFTSFNAAFRKLGVWWFRLHRLVYLAVLLVLLHAFAIGVHATTAPFIGTLAVVVALLFAAHFYLSVGPGRNPTILRSITLCYGLVATVAVFAYGISQGTAEPPLNQSNKGVQYESVR